MGSLSNYAENAFISHLVASSQTAPSGLWLALCTADPTDAGTGSSMNETSNAHAYTRRPVAFSAPASRRVTQIADILFPESTGSYASPISHWGIVDSATYGAGNMWAHGPFTPSRVIVTQNVFKVVTSLQEIFVEISASSGAGLSDYAVHKLLDYFFRNQAFTSPAGNTYVFLSSTLINDDDATQGDFTECSGPNYARVEVNPPGGASPAWNTVANGETTNAAEIDFGVVGSGGWGDIVAGGFIDSASGAGNILGYDSGGIADQETEVNDEVFINVDSFHISMT